MAAELYIKRAKRCFDVIFCDPPFPYRFRQELLESIASSCLVRSGSRLLLHAPREDSIETLPQNLKLEDCREYGRSVVNFYIFFAL
jgi:16S rRNA G966 N2-methylase RsmD